MYDDREIEKDIKSFVKSKIENIKQSSKGNSLCIIEKVKFNDWKEVSNFISLIENGHNFKQLCSKLNKESIFNIAMDNLLPPNIEDLLKINYPKNIFYTGDDRGYTLYKVENFSNIDLIEEVLFEEHKKISKRSRLSEIEKNLSEERIIEDFT